MGQRRYISPNREHVSIQKIVIESVNETVKLKGSQIESEEPLSLEVSYRVYNRQGEDRSGTIVVPLQTTFQNQSLNELVAETYRRMIELGEIVSHLSSPSPDEDAHSDSR